MQSSVHCIIRLNIIGLGSDDGRPLTAGEP
jgi:hypothetical protein